MLFESSLSYSKGVWRYPQWLLVTLKNSSVLCHRCWDDILQLGALHNSGWSMVCFGQGNPQWCESQPGMDGESWTLAWSTGLIPRLDKLLTWCGKTSWWPVCVCVVCVCVLEGCVVGSLGNYMVCLSIQTCENPVQQFPVYLWFTGGILLLLWLSAESRSLTTIFRRRTVALNKCVLIVFKFSIRDAAWPGVTVAKLDGKNGNSCSNSSSSHSLLSVWF